VATASEKHLASSATRTCRLRQPAIAQPSRFLSTRQCPPNRGIGRVVPRFDDQTTAQRVPGPRDDLAMLARGRATPESHRDSPRRRSQRQAEPSPVQHGCRGPSTDMSGATRE
jgi:hypothetical protein